MNKDLAVHLNPENFQIDDRNLEDMILYATKLAQVLTLLWNFLEKDYFFEHLYTSLPWL